MSRLSFRPRPLDIHKKLPIVKSVKDFEDEDGVTAASTRSSHLQRIVAEANNEAHQSNSKKDISEIPTPQFVVVDTYERDYTATFKQPTSYLRGRGARAELGAFVEYDLDSEDEDWLQEFNNERMVLSDEKFETVMFKLEVLDHKARERAGMVAPTLGSSSPVILQLDTIVEALQSQFIRYAVLQSVYNYWKKKRKQWQKPVLRCLQPPPPVNDTNPYNVFRPREKTHRLHTRRMQRRDNNVQSFEKLRQLRRNLEQVKTMLETLIKREEKKLEVVERDVSLQRIQMKYKHEARLIEDELALPGYLAFSFRNMSSGDELVDSDDVVGLAHTRPSRMQNFLFTDSKLRLNSTRTKQELKRRPPGYRWLQTSVRVAPHFLPPLSECFASAVAIRDRDEPILLFTRPLAPDDMAAAGIVPPSDPPVENGSLVPPYQFVGRIGRGGRIVFDRRKNPPPTPD